MPYPYSTSYRVAHNCVITLTNYTPIPGYSSANSRNTGMSTTDRDVNWVKLSDIPSIPQRTLRRWASQGKIPAVKLAGGKLWYVNKRELAELLPNTDES